MRINQQHNKLGITFIIFKKKTEKNDNIQNIGEKATLQ